MRTDDEAFLAAFETCTLNPALFNHRGHLRLALLHLQAQGFETTATTLPRRIQRYATYLGAPEKFHATLTHALLELVQERLTLMPPGTPWEAVLAAHPELERDALALVQERHSPAQLATAEARQRALPPDR